MSYPLFEDGSDSAPSEYDVPGLASDEEDDPTANETAQVSILTLTWRDSDDPSLPRSEKTQISVPEPAWTHVRHHLVYGNSDDEANCGPTGANCRDNYDGDLDQVRSAVDGCLQDEDLPDLETAMRDFLAKETWGQCTGVLRAVHCNSTGAVWREGIAEVLPT